MIVNNNGHNTSILSVSVFYEKNNNKFDSKYGGRYYYFFFFITYCYDDNIDNKHKEQIINHIYTICIYVIPEFVSNKHDEH